MFCQALSGSVIEAREGLHDQNRRADSMNALGSMAGSIVLTPKGGELKIELVGDLASMLAAASPRSDSEELRRQVKVVAGAGFEPATFGL